LITDLRATGRKVVVRSSRDLSSRTGLTAHQVKALEIAFDQGYYDIPQRTTLEQLAPLVGCSKSSLNIVLRRAERKLLAEFLGR
jgi:predicted DNA binding protein